MKKLISIILIALLINTPVAEAQITHKPLYKSKSHSYSNKGWKVQHHKK
jgi:hypothetical protein